ncbi:C-X-C chemokine receptor type 2-like [Oculina patagonica]
MTTNEEVLAIPLVVFGVTYYSLVFILSTSGNAFVLSVCYRTIKRRPCSLKWFIANLAIADLTFALLSTFDLISYVWTWVGGQISCKLQSYAIEACYTVSMTTLVLISFERLRGVVEPLSVRLNTREGIYRKLISSWVLSIVAASPLLYAYQAQTDNSGAVVCANNTFGDLGRQIYYGIHAVCFFLVPLIYMIYAQSTIFLTLRSNVFPTQNVITTAHSKRHLKAVKPLVALTVAFAVCWSPFTIVRTLMYFHLIDGGYAWRASQLLILSNTVLDPLLYGIYGEKLKPFLKRLFPYAKSQSSVRVARVTPQTNDEENK